MLTSAAGSREVPLLFDITCLQDNNYCSFYAGKISTKSQSDTSMHQGRFASPAAAAASETPITNTREVFNSPVSHLNLHFRFQFSPTVEYSEKSTISSQFAFQSSILRCSEWVLNGEWQSSSFEPQFAFQFANLNAKTQIKVRNGTVEHSPARRRSRQPLLPWSP